LAHTGYMIGIEGIDAAGKHTQSSLLESWLRKKGFETANLSFPDYDTPIGKEIRAFLSGERSYPKQVQHMLFAANRWEKVEQVEEFRKNNKVIIVNRYSESNIVYGVANGLRIQWLMTLEEGLPKPDLVLVLDAKPEGLRSRRPGPRDSYERNSRLQSRAQSLYRKLAPKFGWKLIDASRDVESVHRSIVGIVQNVMKPKRRVE